MKAESPIRKNRSSQNFDSRAIEGSAELFMFIFPGAIFKTEKGESDSLTFCECACRSYLPTRSLTSPEAKIQTIYSFESTTATETLPPSIHPSGHDCQFRKIPRQKCFRTTSPDKEENVVSVTNSQQPSIHQTTHDTHFISFPDLQQSRNQRLRRRLLRVTWKRDSGKRATEQCRRIERKPPLPVVVVFVVVVAVV